MKTYILAGSIIVSLFTYTLTHTLGHSTQSDSQWIFSPRSLTLQDGIDKQEAQDFLETKYLKIFEELPGFNVMIGVPDPNRGEGKGDFVMVYTFDSKWTRDYYFPKADEYSERIQKAVEKHQNTYDKLFGKYFVLENYSYDEYIMFARAK